MWSKVGQYIKRNNLLENNSLYVVALSGGADSVALLLLLKEHGYNIHAAHCNFHLRGEESDRDEQFCIELCEKAGVALHRVHFDTKTYAELHKVSIEMAARALRYRWFEQLRQDIGAAGICVAHHRDDSVETVLLNLVRGTGLRGLTGIQPRNGYVLRPLLCVSRAEIEQYLAERGQNYVTDSTNQETDVMRNKVRLQVLPLLRELNPAVDDNIQRTAKNLSSAQAASDAMLSRYLGSNQLDISDFKDSASREYVVFEWMKNYGFNGSQVRQILAAETGRMVSSSQGFDVLKDRGRLLAEPSLKAMKAMKIPEEGTYVLPENALPWAGSAKIKVCRCAPYVSKSADVATLDARRVEFPLTVRRVEEGDWMQPYGMVGRKLLSDMMTDCKMTLFDKRRQLVVADARGFVVWMVGLRTSQQAAVTADTTQVLELRLVTDK
ncbi:MAG: tRNA lysidine(34) synthetase TilS [Prevotella sp.]|nr:tRNA lysidine(34) synthetase TilS [Prevotella sp.]